MNENIKGFILGHYQNALQKFRYDPKSKCFVLMFHQICENLNEAYNDQYSIEIESFSKLIDDLREDSYICTIEELFNASIYESRKVVLTFDDAFEGVFTLAYPILQKCNIPFYVFPTVDFIDKEGYLTSDMVRELLKNEKCEIGTHSMTHPILRNLNRNDSKKELLNPKYYFINKFEFEPMVTAYPYGSEYAIGNRERKIAAQNYNYAFSTLQVPVYGGVSRCNIPRININDDNWKDWLDGFLI